MCILVEINQIILNGKSIEIIFNTRKNRILASVINTNQSNLITLIVSNPRSISGLQPTSSHLIANVGTIIQNVDAISIQFEGKSNG